MRWVCPHCKTTLQTPDLGASQAGAPSDVHGPQSGWAYARCFKCDGYSTVELATGNASPINRKSNAPRLVTPPPFKPMPSAAGMPAPPVPAAVAPAAAPSPLSGLVLSDAIHAGPPEDESTSFADRYPHLARGSKKRTVSLLALSAAISALVVALGTFGVWVGQKPAVVAVATHQKPAAPPTPLERAHTAAVRIASNADVKDSIVSSAMAPTRPHFEQKPLFLQARKSVRTMELRTGPGAEFPLFGLADLDERYPVVEWKDRWFRIQLEETPGLTAWVPYERVELFSQDNHEEDQP